ncbi:MAG: hypothetical protein E6Q97_09395 [Desulfurellales bacterium]|nr:MAG: hypothetical protein E6Q97_09395 [Desulfurellales bacterium]
MSISNDIFTAEKAGFRERIASLIGGTTYREPVGGRSTDPNRMTDQDVAAALAYARQGPDDIGPDIAYCIVCGSDWHRARITLKLADALLSAGGYSLRKARPHVLTIADQAFQTVVWQRRVARPEGCGERAYSQLLLAGAHTLQTHADDAIRRAERAFRRAA